MRRRRRLAGENYAPWLAQGLLKAGKKLIHGVIDNGGVIRGLDQDLLLPLTPIATLQSTGPKRALPVPIVGPRPDLSQRP